MKNIVDVIMVFVVLMNFMFLGSNRIFTCIRIVAVQGILLGVLPLLLNDSNMWVQNVILLLGIIALKGFIFPALLFNAIREADVRREVEPLVSYSFSVLTGVILLIVSFWLSGHLPFPVPLVSSLLVPVAFSTILIGLFIIVSRVKAVMQVLGYLVLENGIYLFGVSLLVEQPLLVELGIILDVFVAVFVMGITIFHINREFDHIDTQELSHLSDWKKPQKEES